MALAKRLIEQPLYAWLMVLVFGVGGVSAYFFMGRLEDPAFTIKTALVITQYPGANAEQVEHEVTENIESAIQQMEQIDHITSRSLPGYSEVKVDILDQYSEQQLPQIWDELRHKVAMAHLPQGAGPTLVDDDFGDVYGIYYAVTGDGYTAAQLYDYLYQLRRDILTVDGVANVHIEGQQPEEIIVSVEQAQLIANHLSLADVREALAVHNRVSRAGSMRSGNWQIRVATAMDYRTPQAIAALPVGKTPSPLQIGDIAKVYRDYARHPLKLIRYNGQPALTFGVSGLSSVNVVKLGKRVQAKLHALQRERPLGIELHPLYQQPQVVEHSVNGFLLNVITSVAIVLGVLCLSLGWRSGVVLAVVLSLTVSGTLLIMYLLGINLQRVSLGALIVVMGMLADNAIVICEGMQVRVEQGKKYVQAAGEILSQTQVSLLGATVVGILAFSGIGLSPDIVGEYCFSLFAVAAISLLLSWLLAVGLTPLFGRYLLRPPADSEQEHGLYKQKMYVYYRQWLMGALRHRWLVLVAVITLTLACTVGFRWVSQSFFPPSSTPLFYVKMHFPAGTDIRATSHHAEQVEQWLQQQSYVDWVGSYIGGGADRFMLVYEPHQPDPAYAEFVVHVPELAMIDTHRAAVQQWLVNHYPEAEVEVIRPNFGPGGGADIEYRISGSDPQQLHQLSRQVQQVMRHSGLVASIRDDWGQPVPHVVAEFNNDWARPLGIIRQDINQLLAYASDGLPAGLFREGEQQLPIMLQTPEPLTDTRQLSALQVYSRTQQGYVPVNAVVNEFAVQHEPAILFRRDRARTLTVSADVLVGESVTDVFNQLRQPIADISLPAGYRGEWGGQHEESEDAKTSLAKQIPLGFIAMILIVLLMFGRVRPALVVLLVVPMSICGVTIGLLATGSAFGFMALLGFLSLFGMLIKNAIVLVDEIQSQIAQGTPRLTAVINGSQSRLRPVALAAGTTILGMAPLLWDPFFADMAITIMSGLTFATVLTMIVVPLLYALLFKVEEHEC